MESCPAMALAIMSPLKKTNPTLNPLPDSESYYVSILLKFVQSF